jgi:3-oxoacyl-[acyl-carrier-protein] synthase-3
LALQVRHLPGVFIRGTGAYFPSRVVTNDDILDVILEHGLVRDDNYRFWSRWRNAAAKLAGKGVRIAMRRKHPTTEALIKSFGYPPSVVEKMGIQRRNWAHMVGDRLDPQGENGSDFALKAAERALEDAGLQASDIDALIVTTTTPPRINSSSSLWLADRLGIQAPAYDLRAGCSGGLYALINASLYLQHGCKNVLVVGTEAYSRFLPPTNKNAIFVTGDGAGAAVVSLGDDPSRGVLGGLVGADARHDRGYTTLGPMPPTPEAAARGHYIVQGDPREMVEHSFKKYLEIIPQVLDLAGVDIASIDYHVPHQTSLSVIKSVARHIHHPMERTFVNIHEHGNIGAACLLAGLHEARAAGHLKPGENLLLSVVGGTMTWGAMVIAQ